MISGNEWVVRTSVDPDEGIIGLNGYFYLEEDDGSIMTFPSKELARHFIANNGEDPDDEYLDYIKLSDTDTDEHETVQREVQNLFG